jgi:hypothetical protein
MKISTYRGVTRSVRCESRQWRAQCAAAGKTYHLGNFETEEEAARCYDNLLHYLKDFGYCHPGLLNFPGEYESNPPPMTDTTRRVILDCSGRQGARDPKRLHKTVARCLPLLHQIAASVPELEDALTGRPVAETGQPENQNEQSE